MLGFSGYKLLILFLGKVLYIINGKDKLISFKNEYRFLKKYNREVEFEKLF